MISLIWVGLTQPVEGLNTTKGLNLLWARGISPAWLPSNRALAFSCLLTWTETSALPEFQSCWPLDWYCAISSLGSSAYWMQILELVSRHNHVSQLFIIKSFLYFLIIHLFIYMLYMCVCVYVCVCECVYVILVSSL